MEPSMTQPTRRSLIAGLTSLPAATTFGRAAFAQQGEARRVPYELVQDAIALDGAAFVGSRQPDVVIVEFFDYNCPFCRQSAQDMDMLLGTDEHLGYVLVNYAILGEPSVEASPRGARLQRHLRAREVCRLPHEALHLPGRQERPARARRRRRTRRGRPTS
jgi:protein-disulfide isomerase